MVDLNIKTGDIESIVYKNFRTTTNNIGNLTANIINERNPVCYGADSRWANHLYPVYVTECYAKSKYLSNTMFLNLF